MTTTTKTVRGNAVKTKPGNAVGKPAQPAKTGNAAGSLPIKPAQSTKPLTDENSSLSSSGSNKSYKEALLSATKPAQPAKPANTPAASTPNTLAVLRPAKTTGPTSTPTTAPVITGGITGGNRAQRRAAVQRSQPRVQSDGDSTDGSNASSNASNAADPPPNPPGQPPIPLQTDPPDDPGDSPLDNEADPDEPDTPSSSSSSSSSSTSGSSAGTYRVAKHRRRGTAGKDRRTPLTGLIPHRDLQGFQRQLATIRIQYKGDALATSYIGHLVDAVVSALTPIVQLPDNLEEAAAVVKGWIDKPTTLPKCAGALGGAIADLVRRTEPSSAYCPLTKKGTIGKETNSMLTAAFPINVNQQGGWQALARIQLAYARLAAQSGRASSRRCGPCASRRATTPSRFSATLQRCASTARSRFHPPRLRRRRT